MHVRRNCIEEKKEIEWEFSFLTTCTKFADGGRRSVWKSFDDGEAIILAATSTLISFCLQTWRLLEGKSKAKEFDVVKLSVVFTRRIKALLWPMTELEHSGRNKTFSLNDLAKKLLYKTSNIFRNKWTVIKSCVSWSNLIISLPNRT